MAIPKVIGYTGIIPDRRTQSAEEFTSAAVTWTDYQAATLVPSTNAAIDGMNAAQGEILASVNNAEESSFIAQAAANYQGPWFSGASVVKGESWSHNGLMWAANVTGAGEPQESAQWFLLKSEPELSAIKVMLEQWGYRYVGLFDDGFTYSQVGDAGVDNNNDAWIYVGAGAPNKVVAAGTVPSVGAGYNKVVFNSDDNILTTSGKSIRQEGIGAWDSDTTYPIGGLVKGSKGQIYIAVGEQAGNDPTSDGGANWRLFANNLDLLVGNNQIVRSFNDRYLDSTNIKDFGAVGDGSTDDTLAIQTAIDSSSGSITLPRGAYYLTGSLFFNNLTRPTVKFESGASIKCDENFNFTAGTRGILKFFQCSNPTVKYPVIDGAMLNSVVAPQPFEDGDAGIEYVECTGLCSTIKPNIRNVMTWGVVHVGCEDTEVIAPTLYNCILQSGVGHAGVKSAKVTDFDIQEVGLYGIEVETTVSNDRSFIGNGTVSESQKGVSVVNASKNTTVKSVTSINCLQGFNASNTTGYVSYSGCTALNCYLAAVFDNPDGLFADIESKRDTTSNDAFLRSRSYDYILKVEGGYGFVLDNDAQRYSGKPGDTVRFINGVQLNIQTMEEVTDPIFGRLQKILYSSALDGSYRSQSFKSYFNMLHTKYITLYKGNDVTVKRGVASFVDVVFESHGAHTNLNWSDITVNFANEYIRTATQGDSTGALIIESKDCFQVGTLYTGNLNKFRNMETASLNLSIHKPHVNNHFAVNKGFATIVKTFLTDDWVGAGTPAVTIDGSTTIFDGASPWKLIQPYMTAIDSNMIVKISDTVGDAAVTGGSIQLNGFFI